MYKTKTHAVHYCPQCEKQITWSSKDGRKYNCDSCGLYMYYSYKYQKLVEKETQW